VAKILYHVKNDGDEAVRRYMKQFGGISLSSYEVAKSDWISTSESISEDLKQSIEVAIQNIKTFHEAQKENVSFIETMSGVSCWRKSIGIEKVGLYIPGGTASLFSTLLMLAIPAKIAGSKEIIVCTPPDKDGNIHPAILYCALRTGINRIFKIGGVQAVAAMAYGTDTVSKVYKIFGPGNQYVTCAKMLLNAEGIAIDMPAGPSELAILADESCVPEFVAADLLSQAEHGIDSQVLLVTDNEQVINEVIACLEVQLKELPRNEIARQALLNSKAILVKTLDEGMDLLNEYAPEHLIISCRDEKMLAEKVINAGSVFLGNYSPESAGDYASGTNHTLPTNGFAKSYSGVSLDSFVKKITFQKISYEGLELLGPAIKNMAEAEGLQAHADAVSIRLKENSK
jgi:histidinol dehydrogenase